MAWLSNAEQSALKSFTHKQQKWTQQVLFVHICICVYILVHMHICVISIMQEKEAMNLSVGGMGEFQGWVTGSC